MLSREEIKDLKETYTKGMRLECIRMPEEKYPVPKGTKGTVILVDDAGTIHVQWDNGSSLGLIPNVDKFKKLTTSHD